MRGRLESLDEDDITVTFLRHALIAVRGYVKRLGNLALMLAKSNSDLKSSDFATKKAVYKDSPYELTRQISSVHDWNDAQISERQKGLAGLALKAWPL